MAPVMGGGTETENMSPLENYKVYRKNNIFFEYTISYLIPYYVIPFAFT